MTDALATQRRWEVIASFVGKSDVCPDPVVMPYPEGGGILVIHGPRAFRFTNGGPDIIATVWEADSAGFIYAWRVCHFSDPLGNVVHAITGAVSGQD